MVVSAGAWRSNPVQYPPDVVPSGRYRIATGSHHARPHPGGQRDDLMAKGQLTAKLGSQPVCVFWSDGRAYAVDDRCPHMGFPLHRGTVENGLLTCHWHHARFDLDSGGTLDPFADDVRSYPVEVDGDDVVVVVEPAADRAAHLRRRLDEGLEQGLTLVMAKAVLGLVDALGPDEAAAASCGAGRRVRHPLPGAGLGVGAHRADRPWPTCSTGLDPEDRVLALVHGLTFVSRDTRGHAPRFALEPLRRRPAARRLAAWYRRFVDTRSGDAAERSLASAVQTGLAAAELAAIMGAAATDHVFLDGGHTIDFTNKAFEVLDHVGWEHAGAVAAHPGPPDGGGVPSRGERQPGAIPTTWPACSPGRPTPCRPGWRRSGPRTFAGDDDVDALAWVILGDDPAEIVAALDRAVDGRRHRGGAGPGGRLRRRPAGDPLPHPERPRRLGRRPPRLHRGQRRAPAGAAGGDAGAGPGRLPGRPQGLPRPVPQRPGRPAAGPPGRRGPTAPAAGLGGLQACWDQQDMVDEAGAIVYGWLAAGGSGRRCWPPWVGPPSRGRRVPLVPDVRGRGPPVVGLAGGLRAGRAHPGRDGPLPGRPHADPPRAAPGGAHRRPAAAGRAALRAAAGMSRPAHHGDRGRRLVESGDHPPEGSRAPGRENVGQGHDGRLARRLRPAGCSGPI